KRKGTKKPPLVEGGGFSDSHQRKLGCFLLVPCCGIVRAKHAGPFESGNANFPNGMAKRCPEGSFELFHVHSASPSPEMTFIISGLFVRYNHAPRICTDVKIPISPRKLPTSRKNCTSAGLRRCILICGEGISWTESA